MEIKYKDLTTDNLFDFCAVLEAVGIEEVFGAFSKNEIEAISKSGKDLRDIGLVIVTKISGVLVRNLPKAKSEIYTFVSNCVEWDNGTFVTVKELGEMKAVTFIKIIKDLFTQEGMADFFREAAECMGLGQKNSKN